MQTGHTRRTLISCLLYTSPVISIACSWCHTRHEWPPGLVASLFFIMLDGAALYFGDVGCVTVLQAAPRGIPLWWASRQSSCWPTLQRPSAWSATRSAWWATGWTQTFSLVRMAASAPCLCSQVCLHNFAFGWDDDENYSLYCLVCSHSYVFAWDDGNKSLNYLE